MNNILKQLKDKKCLIIPHQSPDGDCLGSSFSLSHYLDRHNIHHKIIIDDEIPTNYQFLIKDNMITSDVFLSYNEKYDIAVILDTSSLDRVGAKEAVLDFVDQTIVIDHHKTNTSFGDINVVEMKSSVGEILYNLYQLNGYSIDQTDAIGLYTSIVTDTGEFKYSNTDASTLHVVAALYETGFDFSTVNQKIYMQPLEKVKLQSRVIDQVKLYFDGKVAFTIVTQDLLKELKCKMFHSDGIVEAVRDIEGVELSIMIKELDSHKVKASLRSKSYFDVSELSLIYDGGGHARAAGCTIHKNIGDSIEDLMQHIEGKL